MYTFLDRVYEYREKPRLGYTRLAAARARTLNEELHVVSSMQHLHHVLQEDGRGGNWDMREWVGRYCHV